MHSSKTLLSAAVVVLVVYGIVNACECRTMSTEESFKQADAVFIGRVVDVEPVGTWQKVTFDVNWRSKGDATADVSLFQDNSAIDYQFETDRTYFVFANKSGGRLFASRCSGTRSYDRCANRWGQSRVRFASIRTIPHEYTFGQMALITGISVSLSMGVGLALGRLRRRLQQKSDVRNADPASKL